MSKRTDVEFLKDIKEAMTRIETYARGVSYEGFLKDTKTQDAVVRNLEIIGEAVKSLSADLKKRQKGIAWKDIAGMRDKIIHHYFGVNWDIVWDVIQTKLPGLKAKIENLLQQCESE